VVRADVSLEGSTALVYGKLDAAAAARVVEDAGFKISIEVL
jgi:hypothetical protein